MIKNIIKIYKIDTPSLNYSNVPLGIGQQQIGSVVYFMQIRVLVRIIMVLLFYLIFNYISHLFPFFLNQQKTSFKI